MTAVFSSILLRIPGRWTALLHPKSLPAGTQKAQEHIFMAILVCQFCPDQPRWMSAAGMGKAGN